MRLRVYEASDRLGGRCWSIRGAFADGQIAEHGGELIDQGHNAIRNLVHELGLTLDNLLRAEANGTEPPGYFNGAPYSIDDSTDDLKQIWQKIHSDTSAAGYPTTFDSSTQRGRELDRMSIVDWIEESVPGGMRLAARAAARCRLQHRVRRRVERAELAQPPLPPRLRRPGAAPPLRQVEREVPRARRQRPDPARARGRRSRRRSRRVRSSSRSEADARRRLLADVPRGLGDDDRHGGQGRARAPVLDPAASVDFSEGRLFEPRKLLAIRELRHGYELEAPRPVPLAALERARLQRRHATRTPATRTRGR